MSSSQDFLHSSQLSVASREARKSNFTYKHLAQLALSSTSCPLRVIAHIDLDAFYAQCEMVRLGTPEDQPLAVQQWGGLIAINYPARAFGMNRHIVASEAKRLCPNIILQHVATWKEGDDKWAYREDEESADIHSHKVSLDPYRLQSRKILSCIKEHLPPLPIQRVEKASIDEVFLDLSKQVHGIILERYPELAGPAPYDDPTERLPRPPTTALDWDADAVIDLDETQTEDDDPDWDDVAILIGSEIVRGVRRKVREELKYTCSAGLARNKMLAKLGSGHKKPNQQTVIRNRAVNQFLSGFDLTKIRNLGGKLGEQVVTTFGTEDIKQLLEVPVEQMKVKIGDDTGSWLWHTLRGEDSSEVNSRTQIKSMLSAKSFKPSINSLEQAERWLRIFAADIFSRLVEEGVLEHKRRPKTMNLHHRQGGVSKSRQIPIPSGKMLSEALLLELSKTLLGQVIVDGRAWPCSNLSLSVGGFEDGPSGHREIGSFFVKGEEAKLVPPAAQSRMGAQELEEPLEKRRKVESSGIERFFCKMKEPQEDTFTHQGQDQTSDQIKREPDSVHERREAEEMLFLSDVEDYQDQAEAQDTSMPRGQTVLESFFCSRCSAAIPKTEKMEHEDWHFARDLQASSTPSHPSVQNKARPAGGPPKKAQQKSSNKASLEKGQQRLAFK